MTTRQRIGGSITTPLISQTPLTLLVSATVALPTIGMTTAELLPPIQRRDREREAYCRYVQGRSDPMALQAIVILRGVLADLRTEV